MNQTDPLDEIRLRCNDQWPQMKAAINAELLKARLVELDLLEQALNEGRDIAAFKLQRLKDLTERLNG